MITSDGWSSRCESGNCVETSTRTVDGHEYVEVRDTAAPENCMVVPAKAWAEHEAALRAEGWQQAAAEIRQWAEDEIRLQSSWVWYTLGEKMLADVANRIARRLEPEGPRKWAIPEIPADVTAVRDREGFIWRREDQEPGGLGGAQGWIWRRSTRAWTDDTTRLMTQLGPLTEVRDDTKGTADDD